MERNSHSIIVPLKLITQVKTTNIAFVGFVSLAINTSLNVSGERL